MVHDAKWPVETSFRDAIGPLAGSDIASFVMLRTCKADTVAGLRFGQESSLDALDPAWQTNGKWGMIQAYFKSI
jgi:hypothetical protein